VTSKDLIACSDFVFKGVMGHSLRVWLLIPLLFHLFLGFSLRQMKVKPLSLSEVYPG